MPLPTDQTLYEEAKDFIYSKYKKNSAFRSGAVVKEYKQKFAEKYGKETPPYSNDKQPKSDLKRWFDEQWIDINPLLGFKDIDAYPLFRPTKYINENTPTLFQEIPKSRLKELYKQKQKIKGERNLPTFLPENLYPKTTGGKLPDFTNFLLAPRKPETLYPKTMGGIIVKSYEY